MPELRMFFITIPLLLLYALSSASGASVRSTALVPHRSAQSNATEMLIHSFQGDTDGEYPQAGLTIENGGSLYGTTLQGGAHGCGPCGTLYQLTPISRGRYREHILYRFRGSIDGSYPAARPFQDASGNFFGSAEKGGEGNNGILFETMLKGSSYKTTILYRFSGAPDGSSPQAALIQGPSGALYGTTAAGGEKSCTPSCGTVFEVVPNGNKSTVTVLYRFNGGADGEDPVAPLVLDGSGTLYGTTQSGGVANCPGGCGTVFALTPSGSSYKKTTLYAFQGLNDGANPKAGLLIDQNGALYGTTANGGYSCASGGSCGTVFKLTPSGAAFTESILYRFKGNGDGAEPLGDLVAGKAGTLYGTTAQSYGLSSCNCGLVFALTPSGSTYTESVVHAFAGPPYDGATPEAGLLFDEPKKTLYGTTVYGGTANLGTVFKIKL